MAEKSPLVKALDTLQGQVKPLLLGAGFRAHGRTLNRTTRDGLVQVINFQMGQSDPPGTTYIPGFRENWYGQFWINLGIYLPEMARIEAWYKGPPKVIQEYGCRIRTRLRGPDLEAASDAWPIRVDDQIVNLLGARVQSGALPFFDRLSNRDAILEEWGGATENTDVIVTPRIVCAAIYAHRGDLESARDSLRIQAEWAHANNPRHLGFVKEAAFKLGVDLKEPETGES